MATLVPGLIAAAMALLVAGVSPALAGGVSWIDVSESHVAPGMSLEAETQAYFATAEQAAEATIPRAYSVFLLDDLDRNTLREAIGDYDPGWPVPRTATRIEVGTVEALSRDANLVRAHARIEIPSLVPGNYWLMFCDAGCSRAMGDAVPTRLHVAGDPIAAAVGNRVERLQMRSQMTSRRVRNLRSFALRKAEAAELARDSSRYQIGSLGEEVRTLEKELTALRREASSPDWLAYSGWAVAVMLLAGAISSRIRARRRFPRWSIEAPPEPSVVPDRERELVGPRL